MIQNNALMALGAALLWGGGDFSGGMGVGAAGGKTGAALRVVMLSHISSFSVLLLIWPIVIVYVMTRPHVKAAFEGGTIVDGQAPYPPPAYR